jgi:UDP-N-acetyl-D-glucosamine/UDP-N-acetyl-D-galactosamine dehydrogenase
MQIDKIGILGLGYVGLPLAISFGKSIHCIGYDIDKIRINNLKKGIDKNQEFTKKIIKNSLKLKITGRLLDLNVCKYLIVTAPTPINLNKEPDLSFIKKAAIDISKIIKKDMVIILESTVYPGVTEDFFGKIITQKSGLIVNKDFFLGYSPERINPGDKVHTLERVTKVISGSNNTATKKIYNLYSKIIKKVHISKNIKTAEAAKVIENIQRDVNIALVNEYYQLFDKLKLNPHDVLKTASTKWNFLNFKPGLVGGHCIGVDPYYLTYLAKTKGYNPKLILAGREINDSMHIYIIKSLIKKINLSNKGFSKIKILILGATFKENCSDLRNSGSIKFFNELKKYNNNLHIYDPVADQRLLKKITKIGVVNNLKANYYNLIILLVPHKSFKKDKKKINKSLKLDGQYYDFNKSTKLDKIRFS